MTDSNYAQPVVSTDAPCQTSGLQTLLRFLIGRRDAIEAIAASPKWLWTGLMFVLAAGMAREYDAEYIPARPWVVLIPIAASMIASFILYCVSYVIFFRRKSPAPVFWKYYRSFLALFWATAPLALLYAIPFERFLGEYDAAFWNLRLLGLVAAWRVLLFVRVVAVLSGVSFWRALFPVMLFGDGVLLIALGIMPRPIVHFMGGVQLPPTESLISVTTFLVTSWSILLMPLWIIGTLVVLFTTRKTESVMADVPPTALQSRSPWIVAAVSLAMWIPIAPSTQREQRLSHEVDSLLTSNQIADALSLMSEYESTDFPPHYDPRPRLYFGETEPDILPIMHSMIDAPIADWVRELYADKFGYEVLRRVRDPIPLEEVLAILRALPEGPTIARHITDSYFTVYRVNDDTPPAEVARVEELRAMAELARPDSDGD